MFSQVYTGAGFGGGLKRRAYLKSGVFGHKRRTSKVLHRQGVVVKEISNFKKKSSTLNQDNSKDVLRASQELVGPHPSEAFP